MSIWAWFSDRLNLIEMITLKSQEIERLRTQVEILKNQAPVDNFHQVKTPFDTQAFNDAVKKQVVDEMKPYVTEQAHRALAQLFFRQEPDDPQPLGYVAGHAEAEDVFEVHIELPSLHRRMAVYPNPNWR